MPSDPSRQLALPLPPAGARAARPAEDRRETHRERGELLALAAELAGKLADHLDERVRLTLTENTSTMVSFRRGRGMVALRVHRMFAEAPPNVVRALAEYASRGRGASGRVIDDYVRENEHHVRDARANRQARGLEPRGRYHDLKAIYDQLNDAWFGGAVDARIGWGREAPRRRRRSIKMGTYFHDARVIRVHPGLDRAEVPDYFVRFIVFHEMLHQAVPPETVGGKRVSHTPEFRRRERAYPDFGRALAWERRNLSLLLARPPRRAASFDLDDPLA